MTTEREFKPGVYTHFKEGTKYLAYEDTIDEETQLPRISYYNINKPEKKWNRKLEDFMDLARQDDSNKTGQKFKFEFFDVEHTVYNKREDINWNKAMCNLNIGDSIIAKIKEKEVIGILKGVTERFIIFSSGGDNRLILYWRDIINLNKIYGGK